MTVLASSDSEPEDPVQIPSSPPTRSSSQDTTPTTPPRTRSLGHMYQPIVSSPLSQPASQELPELAELCTHLAVHSVHKHKAVLHLTYHRSRFNVQVIDY